MVIRVLSFEGCPNREATRELVERTVSEMHLQAEIEATTVQSLDEAVRYRFLGSPTIQVDGQDIEPGRRADEVSFACRVYRTPNGFSGVPPKQMLVDALMHTQQGPS